MDLSTTYLGLRLEHPLMPGASPLVDDLDTVRQLEDAGASAIVMHSLFEEQISGEQLASIYQMEIYADSFAEARSYFPQASEYRLGPDQYLEQIRQIKSAVSVPVIASLNGTTAGGWMRYAKLMQEAGADALELNVYYLSTDPSESGAAAEQRVYDALKAVKQAVSLPVAVKLAPFFSSLPNLAFRLEELGTAGLVLFNRFYQPDVDLEQLQAVPTLRLSDSSELLLRLRWLAILAGRFAGSLACSGGVHEPTDAAKAIMCGADAVQVVSALLEKGPQYLKVLKQGLSQWLEEHEYDSLRQMQRSMSLLRCPDPANFERANYIRALQNWRPSTV